MMREQNLYRIESKPAEMREEERDLGFGSVVSRESRQRLLNQDGSFNVQRAGLSFLTSLNLYHTLISMSWKGFIAHTLLLYFFSNIFFGLIYASFGAEALVDSSAAPTENPALRGFFFSVQTFATIGYGTIHPVGVIPNLIVTIESYYSLLANALITGLVFARFSRPTAKIIFSQTAIIAPYRGGKGFMFRLVNSRKNQLIELKAQVLFTRLVEKDGKPSRKFDVLTLERERVSVLPLAWTLVHPVDETSPMFGLTEKDFERLDVEILILISAMDETFAQTVHTRSSYKSNEIKFNYKFTNLYNEVEANEPISIDIRRLSQIEKA